MKKTLLVLSLVVCFLMGSMNLVAASYGVKGGINFAKVTDVVDGTDTKMRTGISLGLFLEYELSENLSIQPEVLYSMKGIKLESLLGDVEWKLDYIDIPVLLKYKFGSGESMKPYLLVGPYIGIKASDKVDSPLGEYDADAKSMDFGMTLGLGAQISNFLVEARYSMGLAKVFDDADSKNSVFNIMIGYAF
jgi:opacity protein-like surface antigen